MKWIFYVIVFIYMFYRTVYGVKTIYKDTRSLSIDPIDYGPNKNYYEAGKRITIVCKGVNKNQKVEWIDPSGKVVQRDVKNRVYAQEHFVAAHRTRVPALLLILTHTTVDDTGVWECRSGYVKRNVSICIINPSSFVDTVTEVTADRGRSITLSCQARGEPEPRLLWYRNEKNINDDNPSKYQLMTKYNSQGFEGLLTITSLESSDSGDYYCAAIQESPQVGDCTASIKMNITLHVNFAPVFANGNDTALVPSEEDKSVDLACAAEAYPTPTYRWFKEIGDILSEYPKDVILLQDNGEKAILNLKANASTFGQRYICRATNDYGDAEKVFTLLRLEKPREPDEITFVNGTHESLHLYAEWYDDVFFPVDDIAVQYLPKSLLKRRTPKENDWEKATKIDMKAEEYDLINEQKAGLNVILVGLDEKTDYWIRIRVMNEAGKSPWSKPFSASTEEQSTEEKTTDEEELSKKEDAPGDDDDNNPKTAAQLSDSTFYGIFFAGCVAVVAVACMFLMRMV